MENEKKQAPAQGEQRPHKNHRPPRRRGYFIEPAGKDEKPSAPTVHEASAPAPIKSGDGEKPHTGGNPQNQNQNRSRNGRSRRSHHNNRPKNDKPSETAQAPQNNVQEMQNVPKAQNQQNGQKQQNHPKHANKKRAEEQEKRDRSDRSPEKEHAPQQKNENRGEGQGRGENNRLRSRNQNQRRSADVLTPFKPSAPKSTHTNESEDEYEEIHFPAPEEFAPVGEPAEEENVAMVEVVGIRFKNSGKTYYFAPGDNQVKRGEYAIVETARGREYGEVSMGNTMVKESDTVPPLRPIIRIATEEDRAHHLENKKLEENAFKICNEKIMAHGLDMKLIDAQYTFDNSKLLFYFTSAGRVDFRVLVKDLASVFRTRIELRQIGIRDEAKLMGGMGMCGRPLCCSIFLSDFGQVSIKMAKEQNLSLNSAKISGICGRLMCCLRYEHETYEYEIKRTPPVDSLVRTADGNGIVTEISPLVGTVKVRLLASPEVAPKVYRREEVTMLQKKQKSSEESK